MRLRALSLSLALLAACGGSRSSAPTPTAAPAPVAEQRSRVVSWDILAREPVANTAEVRHILIGWRDLAEHYGGGIDERAAKRAQADADAAVEDIVDKLKAGADFQALMAEVSEDGGSAATGRSYQVATDAQLAIEFRQLSLRLAPGEIGVCQSNFGYHIIQRIQ